jgi:hypothetical protein
MISTDRDVRNWWALLPYIKMLKNLESTFRKISKSESPPQIILQNRKWLRVVEDLKSK